MFGSIYAALIGKPICTTATMLDIEKTVSQKLGKELPLMKSQSGLVPSRGNVFRYVSDSIDNLDARIDRHLSA